MPPKPRRPDTRAVFGAILGQTEAPSDTAPLSVPLDTLRPLPGQPRRSFDAAALQDLAQSVREKGVLTPLLVRPAAQGYEIVAGERRWRAARLAGLGVVPIVVRDMNDEEALDLALIENVQREDLNPVDRVDATARLVARALGVDAAEVPARLHALRKRPQDDGHPEQIGRLDALFRVLGGTWGSFLANQLPVLRFPPDVLAAVRGGEVPYTKALVVARVRDEARRAELLAQARREDVTVETLRALAARRPDAGAGDSLPRRVAQALGSERRLRALKPEARAELERLLADVERLLDGGKARGRGKRAS